MRNSGTDARVCGMGGRRHLPRAAARNPATGWRRIVLGLAAAMLGLASGCALFQPPRQTQALPVAIHAQEQLVREQIASTLDAANQLLGQLGGARTAAVNGPVPPMPLAVIAPAPALTAPAAGPVTAPACKDPLERESEVLALLASALGQLNTSLQNAPSAPAQQQAAFNTGVQTAQSAAVTFGGQYGALIAAGIGILSLLVQGVMNTKQAHRTAQVAHETAQALAGKLPPLAP